MQPENPDELIQLFRFKDFECHNLFYDYKRNEFFVKRSEKTNYYTPVRWKHVFRNYTKKNNEVKDSLYRYIYLYNPKTQIRLRLPEKEWLEDRDRIIKDNKNPEDFLEVVDEKDNFDKVESNIQEIQKKLDDIKITINTIRT